MRIIFSLLFQLQGSWLHYISNASSIDLFNILHVFHFIKIVYYECWNKRIELNIILRDGVFLVVFWVSRDQTTVGQDGEPMFVSLSCCILNSRLLVLWWAISYTKMFGRINECECYSKNITFYFVTTCKKGEVKPRQFSIGSGQALLGHQRAVFKLDLYMFLGYLSSLWGSANSLLVWDKYVTPTGKRLHAGYVQKAEARKNILFCTTARNKQHVRVVQWWLATYIL